MGYVTSTFEVTLDVLTPARYTFIEESTVPPYKGLTDLSVPRTSLKDAAGEAVFDLQIVYRELTDDEIQQQGPLPPAFISKMTETGLLEPGQYVFAFNIDTASNIGAMQLYSASLSFEDITTPPAAVPLPAAFWPAVASMVAGVAWNVRRQLA